MNTTQIEPEYKIEHGYIIWRESMKNEECFKTQPINDIIDQLNKIGFSKPVKNGNGKYCRVLKGDVSKTEFNTELDAYIDCYTYALEHKII